MQSRPRLMAIFAAGLSAVLAGCGGSTPGSLSDAERELVESKIRAIEAEVGFDISAPTFVPEGLVPIPETDTHNRNEPVLSYVTNGTNSSTIDDAPRPVNLLILQLNDPADLVTCVNNEDDSLLHFNLDGIAATSEEKRSAQSTMVQSINFRRGDLCTTVNVYWRFPDSSQLEFGDDMRETGMRIAKSMLVLEGL